MKSKARARTIRNTIISKEIAPPVIEGPPHPPRERDSRRSRVLEHDALDHVGDVLALVRDRLEKLVDLLQLDDLPGIGFLAEELGKTGAKHEIGLALQPVDVAANLEDRIGIAERFELRHRVL